MNTLEVKIKKPIKNWDEFYFMAKKQFLEYEKLEGIPNWEEYSFSIDCSEDQMKFKDMLQIRFIEELTEATMSVGEEPEHFFEEITDAVNFFLSAYIMLGVDFNKLPSIESFLSKDQIPFVPTIDTLYTEFYGLVNKVGYLCNLLKNRPWAQSNYLVDMLSFNERLLDLWVDFWRVIGGMGIGTLDLFDLFQRKVEVNKIRMRSGY